MLSLVWAICADRTRGPPSCDIYLHTVTSMFWTKCVLPAPCAHLLHAHHMARSSASSLTRARTCQQGSLRHQAWHLNPQISICVMKITQTPSTCMWNGGVWVQEVADLLRTSWGRWLRGSGPAAFLSPSELLTSLLRARPLAQEPHGLLAPWQPPGPTD